jgi:hypothetical protein
MNVSVAFDSRVYNLPLIYGDENALIENATILPEDKKYCYEIPNSDTCLALNIERRTVRVILGQFGQTYKMSAPKINIVAEGQSPDEAWAKFLVEINKREDAASLTFDIGSTRRDEITDGLNIPEDEDWSESLRESEDD